MRRSGKGEGKARRCFAVAFFLSSPLAAHCRPFRHMPLFTHILDEALRDIAQATEEVLELIRKGTELVRTLARPHVFSVSPFATCTRPL